jgi:hypothetical protein
MGFLRRLLRLQPAKAVSSVTRSQLPSATSQQPKSSISPTSTRRELLGAVLRDTLARQGIPAAWLSPEMLLSTSRSRESGIHLRLLIGHWDPRLLVHAVALQNAFIVRLLASDPLAADWLMGISWQFALPDESACPAMPHPGSWTANAELPHRSREVGRAEVPGGSADVIAGPLGTDPYEVPTAESHASSVRTDLERLFAVRDAELEMNALRLAGTDATQPMYLKTQPMDLDDLQQLGRDAPNLRS